MTGTWINIGTIGLGSFLGLFIGARLPERMRSQILVVLGIFTFALGVDLFIEGAQTPGENPLIPLVSLLVGALVGHAPSTPASGTSWLWVVRSAR